MKQMKEEGPAAIPLFPRISAGIGVFGEEEVEDYISIPGVRNLEEVFPFGSKEIRWNLPLGILLLLFVDKTCRFIMEKLELFSEWRGFCKAIASKVGLYCTYE